MTSLISYNFSFENQQAPLEGPSHLHLHSCHQSFQLQKLTTVLHIHWLVFVTVDLADAVTLHWQKGLAEDTHLVHMLLAEMLKKNLQLAAALHNLFGNSLLEHVVGLCCSDETNTQPEEYPLAGRKEVHKQPMAELFVRKCFHLDLMTLQVAHILKLHIVADQMLEPD